MTVLAYRTLGLGDLLTAVPALRGLRRACPDEELVLATPGWLEPLVGLVGGVDRVLPTPELGPVDLRPDVAVNLHGRGPQSTEVLAATRPQRLVAFGVTSSWRDGEHEVHRWCRLLGEAGIPCDPRDLAIPAPDRPAPAVAAGATVVHPGAKDPARRWPADRYAAVARALDRVVVTGGPDERGLASDVAARAGLGPDAVLAGRTDLVDLAAVVAAADRVVCGDTGVAHLATALGTPSVVLFGPTPPSAWGPPRDRPEHVALWAGRRGDPHGRDVHPGLLEIGVDDVLGALSSLAR